ncbi:hypothetical protein NEUTE1DRAFT_108671 [Neurospora tetrasperma FGSC 2508]|uniref:Uncharacterized protein n=1 Tax=Neurospora tetrasperma (strain FGSC 2508 / ATCC MYA-4615 / P0657) TaxID=510951 RepID=F8MJD4_NEUT8|nr:uncharacterized protein NEUTE1DRAFT_108671 [Neurospora tetrasperma FGSC 2508]EGO59131.1 hypothetical protein NEUTE1DRAFT_108671 [Neurospora tetrasperma FGSC 2508]EGZ73241.1 hypothetical protein NEUTE2DRAFT_137600 [Neurospora tetrasperma FGSC 2509]
MAVVRLLGASWRSWRRLSSTSSVDLDKPASTLGWDGPILVTYLSASAARLCGCVWKVGGFHHGRPHRTTEDHNVQFSSDSQTGVLAKAVRLSANVVYLCYVLCANGSAASTILRLNTPFRLVQVRIYVVWFVGLVTNSISLFDNPFMPADRIPGEPRAAQGVSCETQTDGKQTGRCWHI